MKQLRYILFALCLWVLSPQAWCDEFDPANPGDPNPAYRLTVVVDPVAGGTAKIDSKTVSHIYSEPGKKISLAITANTDFTFVQWVCGEEVLSKNTSYSYTMPDHDVIIVAQMLYNEPDPEIFDPTNPGDPTGEGPAKPRHHVVLFTSPEAGGTAYPSNFYLREDESRELHASPAAAYEFAGWYKDGQLESMTNPVTLKMGKEDITLTARFRFNPVSPDDPGVNYLDENSGIMIIDHFTAGHLVDAVQALTTNYERILHLTVVGAMNASDYNFIRNCIHIRTADFSRTTGYTSTASWSFSGLTELQTVMLPASIETMGNQAFYNCTSLRELVLYAPVPPTASKPAEVFKNVPEGLVVRVPAESLPLYQESTLWNQFSLMPMDMKTLTVNLPGDDIELYQDMFLELLDTKSGQLRRYVVTMRGSYGFSGVFEGTIYQLTLRNAQGIIFGQEMIDFRGDDMTVSFASLLRPAMVTALLKDKNGNDATDHGTFTWYDVDGNYLSKGLSITGLVEKDVLLLGVGLDDQLGRLYWEPDQLQQVYLKAGKNTAEVKLEPVATKLIHGTVTDQTGVALQHATVVVNQQLNGKQAFSTMMQTSEKGVFSGDILDVPFEMTVSANFYQKQSFTDETMPADNKIALNRLKGTYIYVTLPPYTSVDGKSNIVYSLYNITEDRAIEDFEDYDDCLMLAERLHEGDEIRVTGSSKTGSFNPSQAVCVVGEGGAKASVSLPILTFGGIEASYDASENEKVMASLYDAEGKYVQHWSFMGKQTAFSNLPDGAYTVVAKGAYDAIDALPDLAQFAEAGLTEGTDYVKQTVTVQSGQQTPVHFDRVPTLDEEQFNYMNANASFTANQHIVVVGNYLTLTGVVDFKPGYADATQTELRVEIPDGCRFVDNSAMEGSHVTNYTLNGKVLVVPVTKPGERIRFCVVPTQAGSYSLHASVGFQSGGKSYSQSVGSAPFEAEALSINAPEMSVTREITVSGSAMPRSEIVLYDNNSYAGVTTAAANGQWQTTITLHSPYDFSQHAVHAKITTPEGLTMLSETRDVTYNKNGVEVSIITMSYINAEEHKKYDMLFDMLYPTKTPNKYRYGPGNHNFDFTIDFTKNDPDVISDVELFVKTKNGLWHAVKTEYDAVHGDWRGSEYFDGQNDNLPVNVDAGFVLTSGEPVGTGLAFQAQMNNLTTFAQLAEMVTEWHSISWYTYEEGENYSKIKLQNELSDDYVLIHLENLDYEATLPLLGQKQFAFTAIPHGYFCLHDEFNDDYYEATLINSADHWAYKIRVARPGKPLSPRHAPKAGEMSTEEVIAAYSAEQSELFTQGLELYTGITSLGERADATGLKQMVELLAHFVKEQKKLYSRVEETITAKNVYGDYMLSDAQRGEFTKQLKEIARKMDSFQSKYALYLDAYSNMLREASMYNMTIMLLSKTVRPSLAHAPGRDCGPRRGAVLPAEEDAFWSQQKQWTEEALANEVDVTGWQIFFETEDVVEPGDEDPEEHAMEDIQDEQDEVIYMLVEFEEDVQRQYPQEVAVAGKAVQPRKGRNPDALVSYDPAGFVYEGVSSNRVEGVKATVYYKQTSQNIFGETVEEDIRWDASEYDQENPLYTDEQGFYQWFVPQGLWQVRFEKAGYEPTQSEWLPVPPPQLEVNIPIIQLSQPEVINATAYPSGIEITFDKYMEPALLNTENIFVMAGDQLVEGHVELMDEEFAYGQSGVTFASQARFVPDERLTAEQITLTVSNRVRSYAGVPMSQTFQQVFDVLPDEQAIAEHKAALDALTEALEELVKMTAVVDTYAPESEWTTFLENAIRNGNAVLTNPESTTAALLAAVEQAKADLLTVALPVTEIAKAQLIERLEALFLPTDKAEWYDLVIEPAKAEAGDLAWNAELKVEPNVTILQGEAERIYTEAKEALERLRKQGTDIDTLTADPETLTRKELIDNVLYIVRGERMFTVHGQAVQ